MRAINVIVLGLLFLTFRVEGQQRENRQNLDFIERSEMITEAIGYGQNEKTGEWFQSKNKILVSNSGHTPFMSRLEGQYFNWIQICKVIKNDKSFYILLIERQNFSEKEMFYFLLDESKYKRFRNQINSLSGKPFNLSFNNYGSVNNKYKKLGTEFEYNDKNLLADIYNKIGNKGLSDVCMLFNSQNLDGNNIIGIIV